MVLATFDSALSGWCEFVTILDLNILYIIQYMTLKICTYYIFKSLSEREHLVDAFFHTSPKLYTSFY